MNLSLLYQGTTIESSSSIRTTGISEQLSAGGQQGHPILRSGKLDTPDGIQTLGPVWLSLSRVEFHYGGKRDGRTITRNQKLQIQKYGNSFTVYHT